MYFVINFRKKKNEINHPVLCLELLSNCVCCRLSMQSTERMKNAFQTKRTLSPIQAKTNN